jgi:hypothetical protein
MYHRTRTLVPILKDNPLVFYDYLSVKKQDLIGCDRAILTKGRQSILYKVQSSPKVVTGLISAKLVKGFKAANDARRHGGCKSLS